MTKKNVLFDPKKNYIIRADKVFEFGEFALKYPHHRESLKNCCKRK